MKIEDHLKNLKESLEIIEESIEKGLMIRQRTIGFNTSAACMDMLEIYLHKHNLITTGAIIKHEWFSSLRRANEKIPFDFQNKEEIINLILKIEEKRNLLCYGKPQKIETIREIIDNFNKLKNKFKEGGVDEI